jgi:hypothetical protein
MSELGDEVERAIRVVGAVAHQSERVTSAFVMEALRERFAARPIRRTLPIWEDLREDASIQEPEAWRCIGEFCAGRACILAFDPHDEAVAFEFGDAAQIPAVIDECFRFEFYVTDERYSFLLCFNHHDFLIAAGAAGSWLLGLNSRRRDGE